MSDAQSPDQRVTQLDGLRGMAALGVLVFHYQHFGGDPRSYPFASHQPFDWLYARGWLFVDFFFLLSGVVMTRKYLPAIMGGSLSGQRFLWLRLSRVYPLHLAGLCLMALLQWYRLWRHQPAVIYAQNDAYHFVLNLGFLHAGAFEEGFSFDAPSWSVAVEVFAYVAFFLLARRGAGYGARALVAFLVGFSLCVLSLNVPFLNLFVGRGFFGFFLGSLLYLGLSRAETRRLAGKLGLGALVLLAGTVAMSARVGSEAFVGGPGMRAAVHYGFAVFPPLLVAALEVRVLAALLSWRPFAFLGDISYAVYLLHIPVQVVILTYAEAAHLVLPTASPALLVAYVGAVVALATVVHYGFEVPARARLRAMWPSTRS